MTTLSSVAQVTEQTFEADVLRSKVPVLLDFTAAWCGPCRALAPILDEIASEAEGKLVVRTVDGDENPGLSARFKVRGPPTVIAFVDGKEVGRHLGLASKEKLLRLLEAR